MAELEPITPTEAKEMFLAHRRAEVAEATLQGYHYRLKPFDESSREGPCGSVFTTSWPGVTHTATAGRAMPTSNPPAT
jgi:hypothetical protein